MKERKDIAEKYKWDLSVIYADENAFNEDYKRAESLIKAYAKHEKTMTRSASDFLLALTDMSAIEAIIERLWQYSSLNFAVDTSNNKYQALNARVRNLLVMAGEVSWFISP